MQGKEFFQVLPGTDRRWIVLPTGEIRARRLRRGGRRDSPLSAVARLHAKVHCRPDTVDAHTTAGKAIKLPHQTAKSLAEASDNSLAELKYYGLRASMRYRRLLFQVLNLPQNKL